MRPLFVTLRRLAVLFLLPVALVQAQPPDTIGSSATAPNLAQPAAGNDAAAVAARPVASTTVASDSNFRARPKNYQDCSDRVAAAKGHPVDILFVGDSITEGWTSAGWGGVERGLTVWNKVYAARNALNFGVGADATQNVLWRFDTMDVKDLKPKVIVLMIGTNNTRNTADQIAAGVHAVLGKMEGMYPAARIILVSILPNQRAGALMTETNGILRTYADDRTVFYLDLVPAMPPVGDNWQGMGPDHLHPTVAGYQIWADAMEPLLTRLLAMAPVGPVAAQ
jgi:lysophospholipase L1-like esterase